MGYILHHRHKIWIWFFSLIFYTTCSSSSMYEMFVSKVQLSFYDCLSFEIFSPTDCSASKNAALDDYQTGENIKCFSLDMHSYTLVDFSFVVFMLFITFFNTKTITLAYNDLDMKTRSKKGHEDFQMSSQTVILSNLVKKAWSWNVQEQPENELLPGPYYSNVLLSLDLSRFTSPHCTFSLVLHMSFLW